MLSTEEKAFLDDPQAFCGCHSPEEARKTQASIRKKAEQAVELLRHLLAYDLRPPVPKKLEDLETPKDAGEDRLVLGEVSSVDSSRQRILFLVEGDEACRGEATLFPMDAFKQLLSDYKKIP